MKRMALIGLVGLVSVFDLTAHAGKSQGPRKVAGKSPSKSQTTGSLLSIENTLDSLFASIRNDDFERIYTNDSLWTKAVRAIKQEPLFQQERDLIAQRNSAKKEYYVGTRYAELAKNALMSPRVKFLERRNVGDRIVLYYRLTFSSPEKSPRTIPTESIRERIVRISLDSDRRFIYFDIEQGYDIRWDKFPGKITWVSLAFGALGMGVRVGCVGAGDFEGSVKIGQEIRPLEGGGGCERSNREARFDPNKFEEHLGPGSRILFRVTIKFVDGTTDTVSVDTTVPDPYHLVVANAPKELSAFETKSKQMSDAVVISTSAIFIREN